MNISKKYVFLGFLVMTTLAVVSFYQGYCEGRAEDRLAKLDRIYDPIKKEYVKYWKFPFLETLRLECDSCSYVSGPGWLKNSGFGKKIDSYDCVIRVDDVVPDDSGVADVGKRTTVLVVGLESFAVLKSNLGKRELLPKGFINDTIIVGFDETEKLKQLFEDSLHVEKNLQLYLFTPRKRRLIREEFDSFRADINSSLEYISVLKDFYSLTLAQDVCNYVHVFALSDTEHCLRVKQSKGSIAEKECQEKQTTESYLLQKVRQKMASWVEGREQITMHYPE